MEIRSKRKFFELWEAGVLGNRLKTWRDLEHALTQVRPGDTVGFRQLGVAGGGAFETCREVAIPEVARRWRELGREFVICESAPDHHATLQGELMRDVGGLAGFVACPVKDGKRMRQSLAEDGYAVRGFQANDLLNRYMDPSSRADLEALFDLFPDHVVEFTCYRVTLGCIPGRNTIIWECRGY
jgi:hypothetical protein